jgi:hypothetical protein
MMHAGMQAYTKPGRGTWSVRECVVNAANTLKAAAVQLTSSLQS